MVGEGWVTRERLTVNELRDFFLIVTNKIKLDKGS